GWGLLVTGLGVGMGIGMLGASWVMRFVSKQAAFPAAIILAGFLMTLTANGPSIGYVMLGAGIMGLCAGFAWVTGYTLLHENVSDELRGRTFATLYALVRLCLFLSLVVAPLAVIAVGEHTLEVGGRALDVGGVRLVLMAGGVLAAVSGLVARRRMRERPSQALLRLGLKVAQASGEHRGLLVVFEGVEGSGKSTQLEMLREELTRSGREVVVTREPGGTAIAERIREILLDTAAAEMVAKTEALLYAAARAQHVSEVVAPALERGAIVLSDRYLDSSLAYQGLVRGLGHETILELNRWASGDLLPDVVILLKVDPAVGLARAGTDLDRLESEGLEFHQRVAKAFLTLAREYRDRYVVIDATGSPEEVQAQVRSAVAPRL
ncbi:MAG: dTMP kinase, partial [Actinomycetota bacterium]